MRLLPLLACALFLAACDSSVPYPLRDAADKDLRVFVDADMLYEDASVRVTLYNGSSDTVAFRSCWDEALMRMDLPGGTAEEFRGCPLVELPPVQVPPGERYAIERRVGRAWFGSGVDLPPGPVPVQFLFRLAAPDSTTVFSTPVPALFEGE